MGILAPRFGGRKPAETMMLCISVILRVMYPVQVTGVAFINAARGNMVHSRI